ncbi:hypothetical protein [Haloarcula salinisoli]|uniref:Uncharacterized protein n=1 Tax=Haloarcula salinisoli TaxID=2487746 RepID=A0A8J7YL62_9EURY|nr:hypothetical protein [Halomicroarcula salinisoli]MBX0287831.1 hypothetical protein [Halomicroarcula salinisoli]MBX0304774.1 hypothetical protein [Halomicroarcula salinisoli]
MVWDQSRTARLLRGVTAAVGRASEGSTLVDAAKRLTSRMETIVRNSYCYRWLTTEPDPEVIVIDLRETRTIGPFVRLLEWGIDPIEQAWMRSRLASVTAGLGPALLNSRTGRLLGALLEPPSDERQEDERE